MLSIKYKTVEEYFSKLSPEAKGKLEELRSIIRQAAPKATEVISYNMPAVKQHGVLVYYAANKEHIGLYPTGSPIVVFKDELAAYKTSKGAIQLPMDEPLPKTLIKKIVKYRMTEDAERAARKKAK